jgi:hypothetical protein
MLERSYVPQDDEVIYHYCSPEAFLAICTSKTLRFTDVFSMNDISEMYWGHRVWERAASELLGSGEVERPLLDAIDRVLHTSGLHALPLACCFSRDGDLLSQWRAYAQDGVGYAVGFNAKALAQLPVRPLEVLYDSDQQIKEVKAFILAMQEVESTSDEPRSNDWFQACATLAFDLAALKNPSFSEEKEIRLVHLVNFETSNSSLRLTDAGGTSLGKVASQQPVGFHIRHGIPSAHIDIDYSAGGLLVPLSDVVTGPRNDGLLTGISVFLETVGLPNVRLRHSQAPYR